MEVGCALQTQVQPAESNAACCLVLQSAASRTLHFMWLRPGRELPDGMVWVPSRTPVLMAQRGPFGPPWAYFGRRSEEEELAVAFARASDELAGARADAQGGHQDALRRMGLASMHARPAEAARRALPVSVLSVGRAACPAEHP